MPSSPSSSTRRGTPSTADRSFSRLGRDSAAQSGPSASTRSRPRPSRYTDVLASRPSSASRWRRRRSPAGSGVSSRLSSAAASPSSSDSWAYRRPALPDPGAVLPAVKQGGELLVHRGHKIGKMDAPVGEVPGEVLWLRPAPLHHGGGGVVQGVEGGVVVRLPAPVPKAAPPALAAGHPVEDGGHVVVVFRAPEGGAQGVVQGPEGQGGVLQLLLDDALGPQVRRALHLRGQPAPQPPEGPLRREQKEHPGQKGFIQEGQVQPPVPGPQHRRAVGQDVDQGGPHPPLALAQPGRQSRQAVGHGAERGCLAGQVDGHSNGRPLGHPGNRPPLPRGGHHHQHRQDPAQGDVFIQPQRRQRRQTGAQQGGGPDEPGLLPGLVHRPAGEGGQRPLEGPHRPCRQGDLQGEIDHIRRLPPPLGLDDEAGHPVEQPRHRRHGPGAAQRLPVVKGEGDGEGEDGRRSVPQAAGELQGGHGAKAYPHQRRSAAQAGPRRPHQGQPEGGAVLEDDRPRQHRRQQKVYARFRPQQ